RRHTRSDRDWSSDVCSSDLARQITRVLARESGLTKEGGRDLPDWEGLDATIPRSRVPKNLLYTCMTQYDSHFTLPVVVPPDSLKIGRASCRERGERCGMGVA